MLVTVSSVECHVTDNVRRTWFSRGFGSQQDHGMSALVKYHCVAAGVYPTIDSLLLKRGDVFLTYPNASNGNEGLETRKTRIIT